MCVTDACLGLYVTHVISLELTLLLTKYADFPVFVSQSSSSRCVYIVCWIRQTLYNLWRELKALSINKAIRHKSIYAFSCQESEDSQKYCYAVFLSPPVGYVQAVLGKMSSRLKLVVFFKFVLQC